MSKDYFGATVKAGQVQFDDPSRWRAIVARHENRRVTITIRREQQVRSLQANKWYWSCVVPLFSEWSGYEKDEAHEVLKAMFLKTEKVLPTGEVLEIPGSSARLSGEDFRAYCDRVSHFLAEHGLYVPAPGEKIEASL